MGKNIQYVGARYVIKIYENKSDPSSAEWDRDTGYEPLTLTTWQYGSYLSKKFVPSTVGDPANNPEYWAQTGFYNGQIADLKHDIDAANAARIAGDNSLQAAVDNAIQLINAEQSARENADGNLQNSINANTESIAAEVANRTNADGVLAGSINSVASDLTAEVGARTTADGALSARIDEIVAPSGEAPSAAEVLDARVGADGTTYNSLGAAIRGQVTNLQNVADCYGFRFTIIPPTAETTSFVEYPFYLLKGVTYKIKLSAPKPATAQYARAFVDAGVAIVDLTTEYQTLTASITGKIKVYIGEVGTTWGYYPDIIVDGVVPTAEDRVNNNIDNLKIEASKIHNASHNLNIEWIKCAGINVSNGTLASGYGLIASELITATATETMYVKYNSRGVNNVKATIYLFSSRTNSAIIKQDYTGEELEVCTSCLAGEKVRVALAILINDVPMFEPSEVLKFFKIWCTKDSSEKPYAIADKFNVSEIDITANYQLGDNGKITSSLSADTASFLKIPSGAKYITFVNSVKCPNSVAFYSTNNENYFIGQSGCGIINSMLSGPAQLYKIPATAEYCRFTTRLMTNTFDGDIMFLSEYSVGKSTTFPVSSDSYTEGYIDDNGEVQSGAVDDVYAWHYTQQIPAGVTYWCSYSRVTWVACYDADDNYLGKSNDLTGLVFYNASDNWKTYQLQKGTAYIKFPCYIASVNDFSSAVKIAGALFSMLPSGDNDELFTISPEQTVLNEYVYGNEEREVGSSHAGKVIHFSTPVNCAKQNVASDTLNLQDESDIYYDNSVLMLPKTYLSKGKKTRLVIFCHGAGGTVSETTSQTEQQVLAKYLVANGYAVLDTNGLPFAYADANSISREENVGSWLAMQCYVNAYHEVVTKYNICEDGVFVHGGSMGGITAANLVMGGQIPVIANTAFCPVLDTYNEIWLHPWSNGLPKIALAKLFDFNNVGGNYEYDETKLTGYNPVNNHTVTIGETKYTLFPCPAKYWHCDNDSVVNIDITAAFVQQIKNAGGRAYLRRLPSGGHSPEDAGTAIANPSGNTVYNGAVLSIKPAVEEVFLWIKRFS